MGIKSYQKNVSGVVKTFYQVTAEGVNKYSGKRNQKKRIGITSKIVAERVEKELWSLCREEKPNGLSVKNWLELKLKYQESVEANERSSTNPLGFSPKTVNKKKSLLSYTDEWNDLHLELITPQFVTEKLNSFEKEKRIKRTTTFEIQKQVKAAFSYAVNIGVFPVSPLEKMKSRKVPKKIKLALTHSEVEILLSEAKKRKHPFYFIWLMTLVTGLRRSELAGLKWSDFDFENRLAHVQRQDLPKEGIIDQLKDYEDRTVAIPDFAISEIMAFKKIAKSEFVIETDSKAWKNGTQAEVLRAFCKEIGIKEVTHHSLRATLITLALADGVPTGIVTANVGHAKLSTTDDYNRRSGLQMTGRMDALKISIPKTVD